MSQNPAVDVRCPMCGTGCQRGTKECRYCGETLEWGFSDPGTPDFKLSLFDVSILLFLMAIPLIPMTLGVWRLLIRGH